MVFSHKIVFIKNEAALLYVTMRRSCNAICNYNLMYKFLIQLLPLKRLVFVVHFIDAFWHGNRVFSKGSSQNEIVPLLVVFHLPDSNYKGVNICFYSVVIKLKNFHSCRTRVALVSLVSHSCVQCRTRVAFVSLVLHQCCSCLVLVL